MSGIKQLTPPFDVYPVPWLARKTAPVGPALPVVTESSNARVITVPGIYTASHIIEGAEKLIIVDTGSVADIPYLEKAVKWLGKPVAFFIPSHLHFDHMMAIDVAARHFDAGIALGNAAWELYLRSKPPRFPLPKTFIHFFIPWIWQGLPGACRADLPGCFRFGFPWSKNPFSVSVTKLDDDSPIPGFAGWRAMYTPGHSNECISLWHENAGFLICGDSMRNFEGGEWNPIYTDLKAYRKTISGFKQLDVNAIFFAHGPVLTGKNLISQISNKYKIDR